MPVRITPQDTPNPNARRVVLDRPVQEGPRGRYYTDPTTCDDPLARAILEAEGVVGVMLLPNSVTVSKANEASWERLQPLVGQSIHGYFGSRAGDRAASTSPAARTADPLITHQGME